jgi:hypothetical protein
MDNRFRKLPSDIINLIYEYDGTYRQKYNSVVEEINTLEDAFYRRRRQVWYSRTDCPWSIWFENAYLERFYHVCLRNLKVIQEDYELRYGEPEPPIITKDDFLGDFVFEEETEELTDIEKLFLFIDDDEIDFSGDFVCPKPICYYYFDKILIFRYC